MARRLDQHQARKSALSLLGKGIARRCKSTCELCADSGTALRLFEISPAPSEPDPEQTLIDLCRSKSKL